ncbi:MAG: hypothetical protein BGO78_02590 [Chloroflexi bacterium 44-23]|nr:MAG: hypothetical protein BGO78_02590 [Chloroflexi bacterium 44-23]
MQVKIKATNTILYCKKWEETVAFYKTGLNLLVIFSNDWFVEFKLNERARISVANPERASIQSGDGKGITISLQVDEIEQVRSGLLEARIELSSIKEVWGSKVFYVHDPEGNRLEFWEGRARG